MASRRLLTALVGIAGLAVTAVWLSGCNEVVSVVPPKDSGAEKAPPQAGSTGQTQQQTPAVASLKPFGECVHLEKPDDEQRLPPDTLLSGKSVGKIFAQIAGEDNKGGPLWNEIRFVSPQGKRLHYSALIKTGAGTMTLTLYPEHAPNHVRSFVALTRAGYYDGLTIYGAESEPSPEKDGKTLDYLSGGCPLGTGEQGCGHIGYWLKPEVSKALSHEEGFVGASHDASLESAGCRFYITLSKAPWVDGQYTIFGKITQGLDVARKIYASPKVDGVEHRLNMPVVIEQVTILVREE